MLETRDNDSERLMKFYDATALSPPLLYKPILPFWDGEDAPVDFKSSRRPDLSFLTPSTAGLEVLGIGHEWEPCLPIK